MGIITISRGSYSRGAEIAKKLSEKLGYECISREILLEASNEFNIPEVKLTKAIEEVPTVFDHVKHDKKKYVAFIRETFLEHILRDNVVYHGFAGHFFTKKIPNILKVRILANIDYRIKVVMDREKISEEKARNLIHTIDSERRKWSQYLYGIDTHSTELYDIVLQIDSLTVEGAVEFLADIAKCSCFQTTDETRNKLKEMFSTAKAYIESSKKAD